MISALKGLMGVEVLIHGRLSVILNSHHSLVGCSEIDNACPSVVGFFDLEVYDTISL